MVDKKVDWKVVCWADWMVVQRVCCSVAPKVALSDPRLAERWVGHWAAL